MVSDVAVLTMQFGVYLKVQVFSGVMRLLKNARNLVLLEKLVLI